MELVEHLLVVFSQVDMKSVPSIDVTSDRLIASSYVGFLHKFVRHLKDATVDHEHDQSVQSKIVQK